MSGSPEPVQIDSETLLAQGDELLRSSRRLLRQLDDTIDLTDSSAENDDDR